MAVMRYMEALNQALVSEMERDPSVFIAGEDVASGGVFAVTQGILEKFGGKRIRNTPISESALIGLGIGAALTGLRPVVEIMFMDFMACCMDQIVNQAAKMKYMFGGKMSVPMVVRTPAGAGLGAGPQHSMFGGVVRPYPRIKSRHAEHALRCQRSYDLLYPGR